MGVAAVAGPVVVVDGFGQGVHAAFGRGAFVGQVVFDAVGVDRLPGPWPGQRGEHGGEGEGLGGAAGEPAQQ